MRYDAVPCVPLLRVVKDEIMRNQAVDKTSVGEGWGTSGRWCAYIVSVRI